MNKVYKALPKSVKIGPRTYKVRARGEFNDIGAVFAYGYTNPNKEIIMVRDDMSGGLLRETLLHEIMHAVSFTVSNREAEVPEREEDESYQAYRSRWEHYFIEYFEHGLLGVLRDNPDITAFLLAE